MDLESMSPDQLGFLYAQQTKAAMAVKHCAPLRRQKNKKAQRTLDEFHKRQLAGNRMLPIDSYFNA
tara:strand:+ start:108 stop:305 length:198 start_codon:yes stop_codon:yes gene_type:complete